MLIYNKQKEDEKMKQIIRKNICKLMSERNISKHIDVYENIPAFSQSQFSHVINGESLPTMMQLVGLADFFKVSIDCLLDRSTPDTSKEMNITESCENLAKILTGKNNARFHTIEVVEYDTVEVQKLMEYPEPHYYTDFDCSEHKRTYNAIYFSENRDAISLNNNYNNAYAINKFIKRLNNIEAMRKKGDLDDDDYNTLFRKYLNDVEKHKNEDRDIWDLPF